jgi:hypothetical protein
VKVRVHVVRRGRVRLDPPPGPLDPLGDPLAVLASRERRSPSRVMPSSAFGYVASQV